jgi:hypothetical protein
MFSVGSDYYSLLEIVVLFSSWNYVLITTNLFRGGGLIKEIDHLLPQRVSAARVGHRVRRVVGRRAARGMHTARPDVAKG